MNMTGWMKKWVPMLILAVNPVAQAEGVRATDGVKQATVEVVASCTPIEDAQKKQIDALQREVAALQAEVGAGQLSSDVRTDHPSDVDSHPLWP
jgi:hypothetical protein